MAWLKLIRWPNLLIIALTQFVAWWCIIWKLHPDWQGPLLLTPLNFLLLCLSTVLIAAAGYIINDYFDIRIDVINKPEHVILEKAIPRRLAIIVHWVLNALALLMAGAVAWQAHHPEWLLMQLACMAMLWRYSTTWKRRFVVGNLVVSLMTALTIITLILYEPFFRAPSPVIPGWHVVVDWPVIGRISRESLLLVFALFAFLLTWMREIVKDMEDYKGDYAEGCLTMPIKWGLLGSARFVQGLGILAISLLLASLIWLGFHIPKPWSCIPIYFISGTLIIPLSLFCWHLPREATIAHYHKSSRNLKVIMVFGVLSLALLSIF